MQRDAVPDFAMLLTFHEGEALERFEKWKHVMNTKTTAIVFVCVGIAVAGWFLLRPQPGTGTVGAANSPIVAVTVPLLSGLAKTGESAFNQYCAACHGVNAAGNDGAGPPLVHVIYEPSHHGDAAFLLAAQRGVRAHHWQFGNMPPVEGISSDEIEAIVSYIRTLQRANGIE